MSFTVGKSCPSLILMSQICLDAFCHNKILTKFSEFTVLLQISFTLPYGPVHQISVLVALASSR